MNMPPVVSPQEWEAAREKLLVKEKEVTRARDTVAAERRRMPWMAVDKNYRFEGPKGSASLAGLFEGRRQLIVYRAFYAPDVTTLPLPQSDASIPLPCVQANPICAWGHLPVRPRPAAATPTPA